MKPTAQPRNTGELWLLIGTLVFCGAGYLLLNHPVASLHSLQTNLDRQIPLIPLMAVPYIIFVPLFWIFLLVAYARQQRFRALALASLIAYAVAFIVYALFQTVVPRPVLLVNDWATNLVRLVYAYDQPYNTFPSLHVAGATILSYYVVTLRRSPWWLLYFAIVIVATLFIHQHYLADVIGGVLLGLAASYSAFKLTK